MSIRGRAIVKPLLSGLLDVVNGHPIHARTAFVLSNAFPRSDKILSVAHLLHQLFRHSRAFGCWLRHEWFGRGVQGYCSMVGVPTIAEPAQSGARFIAAANGYAYWAASFGSADTCSHVLSEGTNCAEIRQARSKVVTRSKVVRRIIH
jgi:hypothetical protein